jgi:hypothetical protein
MGKYLRLALIVIVCAYFWYCAKTYTDWHFIDGVDLIFHEAGHAIFSFFSLFISVAAGTGLQIALPLFISIYFFLSGQKVSGALCLLWVGQNLLNVSIYAGDAVRMQLDLLGGDGVIHDWNYLLSNVGLLSSARTVASTLYSMGLITMFLGTILSIYYWRILTTPMTRRVL